MSEVNNVQMTGRVVSVPAVGAASSKGAAGQRTQNVPQASSQAVGDGGKLLPVEAKQRADLIRVPEPADRKDVETAVSSINDFVQSVQRDLRFSIDDDLDRTVIKVIDSDSGDVIRQIPEEVVLELARKLMDDGELQLVNALG